LVKKEKDALIENKVTGENKLEAGQGEHLNKLLEEGYKSTRKEDIKINKEWECITLEDV